MAIGRHLFYVDDVRDHRPPSRPATRHMDSGEVAALCLPARAVVGAMTGPERPAGLLGISSVEQAQARDPTRPPLRARREPGPLTIRHERPRCDGPRAQATLPPPKSALLLRQGRHRGRPGERAQGHGSRPRSTPRRRPAGSGAAASASAVARWRRATRRSASASALLRAATARRSSARARASW